MKTFSEMFKEQNEFMAQQAIRRKASMNELTERQAAARAEMQRNNAKRDVFEELLMATESLRPTKLVKVTGTGNTTCIRGLKRTVLFCADGVARVIHYRGVLSEAVPTGHLRLIDIN